MVLPAGFLGCQRDHRALTLQLCGIPARLDAAGAEPPAQAGCCGRNGRAQAQVHGQPAGVTRLALTDTEAPLSCTRSLPLHWPET